MMRRLIHNARQESSKRSSSAGARVACSHGGEAGRCLRAPAPDPPRILLALAGPLPVPAGMGRPALRREQSRIGRMLACDAAARLCGGSPAAFTVVGGDNARPILACAAAEPLVMGLTHSGAWVGAAVGRVPAEFGIDVQRVPMRPVTQLAAFMNWTRSLLPPGGTDTVDPQRFTQWWALWEAAVKCDGASVLARSTPAFEQLRAGCGPGYDRCWSAGGYWALSRRLDDLHWLAVVVNCTYGGLPHVEWLPPVASQPTARGA